VQLVRFGFSVEYLLDLDIESFDILVGYVLKMSAVERVEDLWTSFVSAQGDQKSVKKFAAELAPKKKGKKTDADRSRRA